MKQSLLMFILILLLFAATVRAEGPDSRVIYPYDMDVIYRQEAAPYIEHVENTWKFYKIGSENLRRIERSTKVGYRSRKINYSFQLELDDNLRPGISTKVQFFNKPIFFVFSVTD